MEFFWQLRIADRVFFWILIEFFESDLPKRIKIDSLNEIGKVDMVKLELKIHKYLSK